MDLAMHYRSRFIVLLLFPACFVEAYVCLLKERLDPTTGKIRYSLPWTERCYCTQVVAPRLRSAQTCISAPNFASKDELWFTDNSFQLTNRTNWTPETLDILLERIDVCYVKTSASIVATESIKDKTVEARTTPTTEVKTNPDLTSLTPTLATTDIRSTTVAPTTEKTKPGDALIERQKNNQFSTYDQDHDTSGSHNCASRFRGAWWYGSCHHSNLNGLYLYGDLNPPPEAASVVWEPWRGFYFSLKKTEMKMRPM